MIKVDNQKVIKRVARQTYHANLKRNMLTILAVVLTTFLIVSVLGIGIGYWQMLSERQIKMNGMDYDIELTEPTDQQVQTAKSMDNVKYAGVRVKCAILDSANDIPISKVQLFWVDQTCWEKQCRPAFDKITGKYPENKDEIMLSAEALRAMGINNPELGMQIDMTYSPLTGETNDIGILPYTFSLSGFYTDFTGNSRGYVSEAFFLTTGAAQTDFTQGSLKITLKNPLFSEKAILKMQKQFGIERNQVLNADTDSISTFVKTIAVLLLLLLMIFSSGYLFIFNTLYISVSKDIRYYGQLKTIGMTSVQLKQIIYIQAWYNSLIGVPIGLILGYFVSIQLIPTVLQIENPELASTAAFSYYPFLFLAASAFSVLTVFISCQKPAKMAGNCAPVEAIRFTVGKTIIRRTKNGLKTMVCRNMFRDKKKAFIVLGSFVISMVIFFTINVVIKENDSKNILDATWRYDLQLINKTIPDKNKPVITDSDVSDIENINGVSDVRAIYSAIVDVPYQAEVFGSYYKELYESRYSPGDYDSDISAYKNGENQNSFFQSKIVGIDQKELELLLKSSDIEINQDLFEAGEIALVCRWLSISPTDAVGKDVEFSLSGSEQKQSIQIGGIVSDPSYFASGYTPTIVISKGLFHRLVSNPVIELLNIDYDQSLDAVTEKSVMSRLKDVNNVLSESKLNLYNDMLISERQIRILGNGVGLIIAILSILNYINMMTAEVQNRQKEFATLESIGMTTKQIWTELIKEGLGYAVISILFSIGIGVPVSLVVFQSMNAYSLPFAIPILSNLILFAAILIVCITIPPLIYSILGKGTVLERLNANDE